MPAAKETDDSAAPESEGRSQPGEERAEAGAARSTGQTARRVVLTAVVTLAALVALRAAGVGQDGSSSDEGDRERAGSSTSAGPSSSPPSTAPAPSTPSSSVAPPDLEPERSPVDVAAGPTATDDPVEVARWWAAVLVAYEGAEPAPDLVARLAPSTSTRLEQELLALPPAASYDAPAGVTGASAQLGAATADGGQQVTVSVETPGALVVYELVLHDEAGAWVVDQATRV